MKDVIDLEQANNIDGEGHSREYFGRKHKYEWRYKTSHVFLGDFNNMKCAPNSTRIAIKPRTEGQRSVTYLSRKGLKLA